MCSTTTENADGAHIFAEQQSDLDRVTASVQLGARHRARAMGHAGRDVSGASRVGCTLEAF